MRFKTKIAISGKNNINSLSQVCQDLILQSWIFDNKWSLPWSLGFNYANPFCWADCVLDAFFRQRSMASSEYPALIQKQIWFGEWSDPIMQIEANNHLTLGQTVVGKKIRKILVNSEITETRRKINVGYLSTRWNSSNRTNLTNSEKKSLAVKDILRKCWNP